MTIGRRAELLRWAEKKPARYLIEDDYDSEFRYKGRPIPALQGNDTEGKVIYLGTFSRAIAPSIRISYMVLPPRLLERYEQTMSFYSCTVSSFEQYTLARFISEGYFERHINKMKNYYREQRHKILAAIHASPLAAVSQITERNAGTHFVLHINTRLTEAEVRKAALAADMCLSFYSDYSHNTEENKGCTLVINYAAIEADKIAAVIERLSSLFPECNQIR